jgi:hypothetical protein
MSDFFQDPPRLGNQYDDDALLRAYLRWRLPVTMLGEIEAEPPAPYSLGKSARSVITRSAVMRNPNPSGVSPTRYQGHTMVSVVVSVACAKSSRKCARFSQLRNLLRRMFVKRRRVGTSEAN